MLNVLLMKEKDYILYCIVYGPAQARPPAPHQLKYDTIEYINSKLKQLF